MPLESSIACYDQMQTDKQPQMINQTCCAKSNEESLTLISTCALVRSDVLLQTALMLMFVLPGAKPLPAPFELQTTCKTAAHQEF